MSETPQLPRIEAHLGKRKAEGAAALAEIRSFDWDELVRFVGEDLNRAAEVFAPKTAEGTNSARELVALVPEGFELFYDAVSLCAPRTAAAALLRVCTSLTPDAVRAALAATDPASTKIGAYASDVLRTQAANALGAGRAAFTFDDAAWARLAGVDMVALFARQAAVCDELLAPDPEKNGALQLGALLAGLASRGTRNVTLIVPEELLPFARWVESWASCMFPKELEVFAGEPLAEVAAYGDDRLFIEYRLGEAVPDPRVRRLNAAGKPTLQIAIPDRAALAGELVRWVLALNVVPSDKSKPTNLLTKSPESAAPHSGPFPPLRLVASNLPHVIPDPALATPVLRDGALSIHTGPVHAHILGKVAGTLGAKAASSAPHWLAAQLAMAEPGDFASIHLRALATQAARKALPELQKAIRDATKLATRAVFGLRGLGPGAIGSASGSERGLFFILSDGGGQELHVGGLALGALSKEEELRALDALVTADRRALLLRAEDGDAARLIQTVRDAAALLKG